MGYGFGGGFGGGNMQALMRQAQKMQEDMKRIREEIDSTEYEWHFQCLFFHFPKRQSRNCRWSE